MWCARHATAAAGRSTRAPPSPALRLVPSRATLPRARRCRGCRATVDRTGGASRIVPSRSFQSASPFFDLVVVSVSSRRVSSRGVAAVSSARRLCRYGLKKIATKNLGELIAAVEHFAADDRRVELLARLLGLQVKMLQL